MSFLRDLLNRGKQDIQQVVRPTANFVKREIPRARDLFNNQANNFNVGMNVAPRQVQQFAQRQIQQPIQKVIKSIQPAINAYKQYSPISQAGSMLRQGARGVVSNVMSSPTEASFLGNAGIVANKIIGHKDTLTPTSRISKLILGTEPITSSQNSSTSTYLKGKGVNPALANIAGGGLAVAGLVSNFAGGSGAVEKNIAKETTEQGIKKLLGKEAVNYSDDVIKALAKEKNTVKVGEILKNTKGKISLTSPLSNEAERVRVSNTPKSIKLQSQAQETKPQIAKNEIQPGPTSPEQPKIVQTQQSQSLLPKEVSPNLSKTSSFANNIPPDQQIVNDTAKILQGGQAKERGFITSVKTSEKTPQQLKDIVSGTYVPKTGVELKLQAKKLIQTDINAAEQVAINPTNDVHIQIGNELINHYSSTGQLAKAKALSEAMANSGTELGRAVQAFANYDKTTPAGAIKFAQTTINKYNQANPTNKLALSDEMVTNLFSKAKQIQNMAEGRERNIASQQLINQVNDLIPSSIMDKAVTVWKAGLLTSLRTTERNLLGNTVHGIAEIAKDVPASIADMVMKMKTGKRSLTLTTKGIGQGINKGYSRASDIMTLGFDPERTIEKFDVKRVSWGKNPVEQGLKKYTDFVFNWMGAQDKLFYHGSFARSLYDQAGAEAINAGQRGNKAFIENLVKNPTDIMKQLATKDATTSVFQDRNALSKMINGLKNKAGGARWATEVVAPFTGVPSSIAGQFAAYSPIGLAKGGFDAIKVLSGKTPELQRQAAQEIGRGVVGTAIAGIAGVLAAKGLITGQPKDAKEADQWTLEGKQANSVMIGGKWRSINSVGPEALVMLAGAKIAVSKDKMIAAGNIGKDFMSQTFLQGVQAPLNAITDPTRYAGTYISGQTASIIPNAIKDVAKAFDPLQRETYVSKNIVESTKNALKSGIPLIRNTLLPKRDVLGSPLPNETSGYKAFVDLFNSKTPINNTIVNELSRLHSVDQNSTPSKLTVNQTVNGEKITITPKQLDKLESVGGNLIKNNLSQLIGSSEYKTLSDEDRAKKIDKVVSDARLQAKVEVLGQTPKEVKAPAKPKVAKVTTKKTSKAKKASTAKKTASISALKSFKVSGFYTPSGSATPPKYAVKASRISASQLASGR